MDKRDQEPTELHNAVENTVVVHPPIEATAEDLSAKLARQTLADLYGNDTK